MDKHLAPSSSLEAVNTQTGQPHRPKAWYALRRTLPPWSFELNLKELEQTLRRYQVDELIVKLDTEEFSHGQPTIEMAKAFIPRLHQVKTALSDLGVVYSLNPWITVGHCDRSRDDRKKFQGFQGLIGHDGVECTSCACPLGQSWRENTEIVWGLYAETEPAVFWIEDDIRTFNHEPVKYSCFCPLHLARFSERVGEPVDRKMLTEAILQTGKPHPWRGEFLDMQAEIMTDTASFLARTIHRASPMTAMGLMSSGPRLHCLEGRNWSEFASAIADGTTLYSRPPMGSYWEGTFRDFYYSQDSIKLTRSCLPQDTIEQTEVENVPFTRYSKSICFTFIEMAISFAYGCHGVTLNLFDHCGTPMENEPWYGKMLADRKPFLEALAEKAQVPGAFCGVQLLHFDRSSYTKELQGKPEYRFLAEEGAAMMELLESFGTPTTYEDSEVVAICGQQILAASEAEILQILSKGVLLDGTAARALVSRGFGEYIGAEAVSEAKSLDEFGPLSAEEHHHPLFEGSPNTLMTLTLPSIMDRASVCTAELSSQAVVISSFVDPDKNRVYPAMFAFENSLGGRVVVHLLDLTSAVGVAFMHPHREVQFQNAVRWLARDQHSIFVRGGVYPLAFRKDSANRTLLGFFNLSLDDWETVEFECTDHRRLASTRILRNDAWETCPELLIEQSETRVFITYPLAVEFKTPLFLELVWEHQSSIPEPEKGSDQKQDAQ